MKSSLWCLLLLLTATCSHAQDDYSFRVRVGTKPRPRTAYLWHSNQRGLVVDSTHLAFGEYTFAGKVAQPYRARVVLGHKWSPLLAYDSFPFYVYVEPGVVRVSSPDSLVHATTTGGQLNADYAAIRAALLPLAQSEQLFNGALDRARTEAQKGQARALYHSFKALRAHVLPPAIRQLAHSPVALDLLEDYATETLTYEELAPFYNRLVPAVQTSPAGQAMGARVAALHLTQAGRLAPAFTQPDSAGTFTALQDFRGRYVLLDFRASWCTPCRAEIPALKELYRRYHAGNFAILGISVDANRDSWVKALQQERMPWKQVSDLVGLVGTTAKLYYIDGVPQNVLVGPTGVIIARNLCGEALDRKIAELMAQSNVHR